MRLGKGDIKYKDNWKTRGYTGKGKPSILVQVPTKVFNGVRKGEWIFKENKEEIWLSMNGLAKLNKAEWEDFKKRVDTAVQKLKIKSSLFSSAERFI